MSNQKPIPGTGGDHYIPYEQRSGEESAVYFTRDLSAEGLRKIFSRVSGNMTGKVAIKLHTGEPHGPNIIPRPWVKELIEKDLPGATIVETNSYYEGGRYTTEQHRETLQVNGWTFCPVDIMDADGLRRCRSRAASGSPRWRWEKTSSTTIRCLSSPTSKATPRAALADRIKTSASAVRMAASARR